MFPYLCLGELVVKVDLSLAVQDSGATVQALCDFDHWCLLRAGRRGVQPRRTPTLLFRAIDMPDMTMLILQGLLFNKP